MFEGRFYEVDFFFVGFYVENLYDYFVVGFVFFFIEEVFFFDEICNVWVEFDEDVEVFYFVNCVFV